MGRLRWPDRVTDRAGNGIVQASCTFAHRDTGVPVVVYPDRLGTLASGQPLICDRNGEVTAFVDEADLPVRVTATLDGWSDSFDWEYPGQAIPTGGAGGVLSGQYPNPGFANDMAFQSELDAVQAGLQSQITAIPTAASGPAGGDLSGTYPNPQIAAGAITDADVAAANKDGVAGKASLRTLGSGAQQAAAGTDARLSDSRAPSGAAGGDLTGTFPNPTIGAGKVTSAHVLDGTLTDSDVAAANKDGAVGTASLRTLGAGAQQAAPGNDARFTAPGPPNGAAGGDLSGSYPNPQIATGVIVDADVAAANKDGAAATPSLRTLGAGAQQAVGGTDARLSDQRTPLDNSVTAAKVVDGSLGVGELSATGVKDATTYLRGDNTFAVPAGGGGSGLAKVTSFPGSPADGDVVVRTDLNGSPLFAYSTENGWEQQPRMGAVTVPSVRAYNSTTQACNTGTGTNPVLFDTEVFDTDAMHPGANNGSFVVRTPGRYQIEAHVELTTSPAVASGLYLVLYRNGVPLQDAYLVAGAASLVQTLQLAAGDVVTISISNTTGTNLTVNSGERNLHFAMTWLGGPGQTVDERGVPACRATVASGVQSFATTVSGILNFPTEDYDTDGMHDTVTSNSRLTVKTPGLYQINGFAEVSTTPSGNSPMVNVFKNGALLGPDPYLLGSAASRPQVSGQAQLAAGDYLELQFVNVSNGTLTVSRGSLSVALLGSGKTVTPFAKVRASGTPSIPNATFTPVAFDAEDTDNDGIHDNVTNNTRLTCRTGGVYIVIASVPWNDAALGTQRRQLNLWKNGATWLNESINALSTGNTHGATAQKIVAVGELAVGDYVELALYQDSGGAVALFAGCEFSMVKVGSPSAPLQSVVVSATRVTTLPVAPIDGQEVYFVADAANGVIWHLRYNAGSSSAYKWEYVGGSRLNAEVLAAESPPTITSGAFQAMTTPGPSITLPLAGDYIVELEARINLNGSSYCTMSYDIGATGAVDVDGLECTSSGAMVDYEHVHAQRLKTGLGAVALVCKYAPRGVAGQTPLFKNRRIQATPVRVG